MSAHSGILPSWGTVREFLFGGNATFTLVSLKTGVRFTYKVRAKKEDLERAEAENGARVHAMEHGAVLEFRPPTDITYFVNLLRGPSNETAFAYMGVLRRPGRFNLTSASRVGRQSPSFRALLWMLDAMTCGRDVLGKQLEVWHEGRCARCGRKLTVPDSVAAGFGPECAGRLEAA